MKSQSKEASFYQRLHKQLSESSDWPTNYLFKFIIPADEARKTALLSIFSKIEAKISSKKSSGNKYESVTVESVFETPDAIIDIYKKASQIEGIIQL
ncbi:MAG: DUF493 family protein [Flavobacteriaceae bacterium]|jgi:putative lipoic acid-binding regulatory protein|nr:DUF493 family protein [Flavobacteriaceae bacterium]